VTFIIPTAVAAVYCTRRLYFFFRYFFLARSREWAVTRLVHASVASIQLHLPHVRSDPIPSQPTRHDEKHVDQTDPFASACVSRNSFHREARGVVDRCKSSRQLRHCRTKANYYYLINAAAVETSKGKIGVNYSSCDSGHGTLLLQRIEFDNSKEESTV